MGGKREGGLEGGEAKRWEVEGKVKGKGKRRRRRWGWRKKPSHLVVVFVVVLVVVPTTFLVSRSEENSKDG